MSFLRFFTRVRLLLSGRPFVNERNPVEEFSQYEIAERITYLDGLTIVVQMGRTFFHLEIVETKFEDDQLVVAYKLLNSWNPSIGLNFSEEGTFTFPINKKGLYFHMQDQTILVQDGSDDVVTFCKEDPWVDCF